MDILPGRKTRVLLDRLYEKIIIAIQGQIKELVGVHIANLKAFRDQTLVFDSACKAQAPAQYVYSYATPHFEFQVRFTCDDPSHISIRDLKHPKGIPSPLTP